MNNRYGLNISSNSISIIVIVLAGMWFARILTQKLGIEGYALVSMTSALVVGIQIFTSSINGAIGRFLTISLSRNNDVESNNIFNSALFGSIAIFIILIPFVVLASWLSPTIFGIEGKIQNVRIFTFQALVATLILSVAAIFYTSCFVTSRFDILSGIQINTVVSRLIIVVSLFYFWKTSIELVGSGMLIAAILGLLLGVIVWKHLTPTLVINRHSVKWSTLKELLSMGFWVSVDSVGTLLTYQLNTILVGHLLNTALAGIFGLYVIIPTYIANLGNALTGPVQPEIYAAYARSDQKAHNNALYSSIRISLSIMALLTALLIGFRISIINIWLGAGYELVATLLVIGVPLFAFSTSYGGQLIAVLNARKQTGWIAFATIVSGIGNILSCILFYYFGVFNIFIVALSSGLWITIKVMILMIIMNGGNLNIFIKLFFNQIRFFIIILVMPLISAIFLGNLIKIAPIYTTLIAMIPVIALWIVGLFVMLYPSDIERLLGKYWKNHKLQEYQKKIFAWRVKKLGLWDFPW